MCPQPAVNYRKLRINNFGKGEFEHLRLLIFWPVFGLLFLFVERFAPVEYYYPIHCPIDDMIPFCEWFLIPYLFWFVYLIGMLAYTLLYDIGAFRYMMKYIIITYSVTILIYIVFPTCQELRPTAFERDNILTDFIAHFYVFDTNTNVCPSIHVLGSLAVMETALNADSVTSKGIKLAFVIAAILICISTVFMKQHSVIDIMAALPLSCIAHLVCRSKKE